MSPWIFAAAVLLFALVPCGIASFRGSAIERLIGLEMAGVIVSMFMLVLAEGMGNPNFYDVGLAMALLVFGGGLVFARFLERYL